MMAVWATFKKVIVLGLLRAEKSPVPASVAESLTLTVPEPPTGRPVQAQCTCCGLSPPSNSPSVTQGIAALPEQGR